MTRSRCFRSSSLCLCLVANVVLAAAGQSQDQPSPKVTVKEELLWQVGQDDKVKCSAVTTTLGCSVAWCVARGAGQVMVLNGQAGPVFDSVTAPYFSPDGERFVYVGKRGSRFVVVVDGKQGPEYDGVRQLAFSPDSRRLAYSAVRLEGKQPTHVVVVDGEEGPAFQPGLLWTLGGVEETFWAFYPVFSADSRHLAYASRRGSRMRMVIDGKEAAQEYDAVAQPVFSPDGRRLAYVAKRDKQFVVVVDEKPGSTFDDVGHVVFSPDSRRVAHMGRRDKKWVAVVDDQAGPEYDELPGGYGGSSGSALFKSTRQPIVLPPVFSPNSQRVAYMAGVEKGRKAVAVIDGEVGTPFDRMLLHGSTQRPLDRPGVDLSQVVGLRFSPDSRRVGYVGVRNSKHVVVVDGSEGPELREASAPFFSRDSQHVTYVARRDSTSRAFVMHEGVPSREFTGVGPGVQVNGSMVLNVAFDSAGDTVFTLRDGTIAHTVPVPRIDGASSLTVGNTAFSFDGRRFAFVVGSRVFVDGKQEQQYDAATKVSLLSFMHDGQHVGYVVQGDKNAGGKSRVVLDGQGGKDHDWIEVASYSGENAVTYIARDGKSQEPGTRYYRVTVTIPKQP